MVGILARACARRGYRISVSGIGVRVEIEEGLVVTGLVVTPEFFQDGSPVEASVGDIDELALGLLVETPVPAESLLAPTDFLQTSRPEPALGASLLHPRVALTRKVARTRVLQ